jgi:hypothetical protein
MFSSAVITLQGIGQFVRRDKSSSLEPRNGVVPSISAMKDGGIM